VGETCFSRIERYVDPTDKTERREPPVALGGGAFAVASGSTALGAYVAASAPGAFAAGFRASASGNRSVAIGGGELRGEGPSASGAGAVAIG
jgi:hypothetical protein